MLDGREPSAEDFLSSSTKDSDALSWLALGRIKGLGCASAKKLIEHFRDPREIFAASEDELGEVPDLDPRVLEGILCFSDWDDVGMEARRASEAGVALVFLGDPRYPARLRTLPDPPPVLYVKGELIDRDERAIAVVGSRSSSHYGNRVARDLCRNLCALGFTIVSGMARGIDATAHTTALAGGGRTLAVLGCGVDVVYPREHQDLYQKISGSGAIVSELAMGTPPAAYHFPARNRLISGLALGVVVVEATEKSGSLITAQFALEQGREVFAVPGEAGSSRSRGTHRLIREGAKLVETAEDVVEEIAPQLLAAGKGRQSGAATLPPDCDPGARKIFEMVLGSALQIDELIEASGFSSAKVSEILLDLEIRGHLKQLPGKRFIAM
jgi:DNA processing protein